MKKYLAIILAIVSVFSILAFAGCGKEEAQTDFDYIKEKGALVIGYTEFAPMNYEDENGDFVGFETEFAKAVCEELGVEAKFQLIDWSAKETELKSKTIDCIWNGMTITPERQAEMDISTPYMANKQVLIVKAENADKYLKAEDLKDADIVAEIESAGEGVAMEDEFFANANYTGVKDQATALMEVASGTADGCVVDYVLSIGMIGEGTDYEGLVVVDELAFADEQYGIAFRKDTNTCDEVNEAITKLVESGKLAEIAKKYKLEEQIIAK